MKIGTGDVLLDRKGNLIEIISDWGTGHYCCIGVKYIPEKYGSYDSIAFEKYKHYDCYSYDGCSARKSKHDLIDVYAGNGTLVKNNEKQYKLTNFGSMIMAQLE